MHLSISLAIGSALFSSGADGGDGLPATGNGLFVEGDNDFLMVGDAGFFLVS